MRKLLILALLLYDTVAAASRPYDYDDEMRRHPIGDDKRSWRRKGLSKSDPEQKEAWDDRSRHEYGDNRYGYEEDKNYVDRRGSERGSDRGSVRGNDRGSERGNERSERGSDRDRGGSDREARDRDRDREREPEQYGRSRFEDDKPSAPTGPKSSEVPHPQYPEKQGFREKNDEKKQAAAVNCDRPHERYETCFAGCASVSCDNPRDRLRPCYPFCEPGCVCVSPYVRDDRTHKCVLPDDCTKGLKGIPDLGGEET